MANKTKFDEIVETAQFTPDSDALLMQPCEVCARRSKGKAVLSDGRVVNLCETHRTKEVLAGYLQGAYSVVREDVEMMTDEQIRHELVKAGVGPAYSEHMSEGDYLRDAYRLRFDIPYPTRTLPCRGCEDSFDYTGHIALAPTLCVKCAEAAKVPTLCTACGKTVPFSETGVDWDEKDEAKRVKCRDCMPEIPF